MLYLHALGLTHAPLPPLWPPLLPHSQGLATDMRHAQQAVFSWLGKYVPTEHICTGKACRWSEAELHIGLSRGAHHKPGDQA